MKKQRQKWVCFLAVLTLVLAGLCACGTQPEQEEPAPVQETEPKGTEASAGKLLWRAKQALKGKLEEVSADGT